MRKLEPYEALRLFRAGKLDEAPVPLGDLRASRLDPQLEEAVRVRRLLAADTVVFDGTVPPELRHVYDATADRADYQALVPEFEAPPAESLTDRSPPKASAGRDRPARSPQARSRRCLASPSASRPPADPDLAYGLDLLVGAWRDLGLGAHRRRPAGREVRASPRAVPEAASLPAAVRRAAGRADRLGADARLVSPRLRGWREDPLGSVDYSRVSAPRLPGRSRRR